MLQCSSLPNPAESLDLCNTTLEAKLLDCVGNGLLGWFNREREPSLRDLATASQIVQRMATTRKTLVPLAEKHESTKPQRETLMEGRLTDLAVTARLAAEEHIHDGVYREDGGSRRAYDETGVLRTVRRPDAPPVPPDYDPYQWRRALRENLQALIRWLGDSLTTPGLTVAWDPLDPVPPPPNTDPNSPNSPPKENIPTDDDFPSDENPSTRNGFPAAATHVTNNGGGIGDDDGFWDDNDDGDDPLDEDPDNPSDDDDSIDDDG